MPSLSLKLAAEYLDREILTIFNDYGIESIELVSEKMKVILLKFLSTLMD